MGEGLSWVHSLGWRTSSAGFVEVLEGSKLGK